MFGIDQRTAKAAWTVLLFALALAVIYLIRRTLLLFVLAILFAYLLSPLVNLIGKVSRRPFSRVLALAAVYVLLVAALIVFGALVGARIVEQAGNLANGVPGYLKSVESALRTPGPGWFEPVRHYLLSELGDQLQGLAGIMVPAVRRIGEGVLFLAGNLVVLVLIPILGFFFLKDGATARAHLLERVVSPGRRAVVEDILLDVHHLLGHFMRALVLLSAATFLAYSVLLWALGVPYSLLLAFLAALLEFIPVLGPVAAVLTIVLVAVFSGGGHIAALIATLLAYRIFQDYVLSPHLMSHGVALPPLLVIFGALAGEQIGGIPGMFLSIPVLATLRVIYLRLEKPRAPAGA